MNIIRKYCDIHDCHQEATEYCDKHKWWRCADHSCENPYRFLGKLP